MATMQDVARRAGVSIATVSFVVNASKPVSPETAARVREAMRELGYRPHALARALARRRSMMIAIVYPLVPSRPLSTATTFLAGAAEAAAESGYSIVLWPTVGGAEKLAADFRGEVVQSEGVKLKELPGALQEMMLPMQVGQATRPFGSLEEGVRVLVICGRDEVDPSMPTFETVMAQMNEERVNMRARRYLRDLRRDAIIDFR